MKVAIVYSIPSRRITSTEFASTDTDTAVIAKAVKKGLIARGYEASIHSISEDDIESIEQIKADCIFNLIEWCGLDIQLAEKAFASLRRLGIPVTGSSEKLYVLSGDKIALKQALKTAGVSVPEGIGFVTGDEKIPELPYPLIVKPSTEHCSMGLGYDTIAHNEQELHTIVKRQIKEFEQPALAEEFIAGREFEVYVLEEKGGVRVLPIEEVVFHGGSAMSFQTYSAKWHEGSVDYQSTDVLRAQLTDKERERIEEMGIRTFKELGFYGYARLDVRMRDGMPYVLEANANPSVYDDETEIDDPEKEIIWGISFADYIKAIVDAALYHFGRGDRI